MRLNCLLDPCGTCRPSSGIEEGVVDNHFRVHGVNNVRAIDASIFAAIPDCRIQNIVYMVGEKVCHALACKDTFC